VFPGQGAQASAWAATSPRPIPRRGRCSTRSTTRWASRSRRLIWEGPDRGPLTLTANAQPALMATSMAALRGARGRGGRRPPIRRRPFPRRIFGPLRRRRARHRRHRAAPAPARRGDAGAVPVGVGAMAAILGLDLAATDGGRGARPQGEVCEAANDNDPAQVVISGPCGRRRARRRDRPRARGAKRADPAARQRPLPLRADAAGRRRDGGGAGEGDDRPIRPCRSSPTCRRGRVGPGRIRLAAGRPDHRPVRWRESVEWMADAGVRERSRSAPARRSPA
jgi:[acyl-carrier-protein] S-malonyltransferase